MRKYKVHHTDQHHNETACGRLLYTYHGQLLRVTTRKEEVTCLVCKRVLAQKQEMPEPVELRADCHCGHSFDEHMGGACHRCKCTAYYANYPKCACGHFARSHIWLAPFTYGACPVCGCDVYRPVGVNEKDEARGKDK